MNRTKTKNRIKELRRELKAANRVRNIRLFKLTLLLVVFLILAALIWPNPVRDSVQHWVKNTFNASFLE